MGAVAVVHALAVPAAFWQQTWVNACTPVGSDLRVCMHEGVEDICSGWLANIMKSIELSTGGDAIFTSKAQTGAGDLARCIVGNVYSIHPRLLHESGASYAAWPQNTPD
ncbi:hypothetical protein DFH27DRAFT_522278 [Peziza echinospora]|nr:hypothetical protein DFH27DRAFT_522278 [Peziza echinospora]